MKISPEKLDELIRKKTNEKWTGKPCQNCGEKSIVLQNQIYMLTEYRGAQIILGGATSLVPLLIANCTNCGNTILINAIHLGLINQETGEVNDE